MSFKPYEWQSESVWKFFRDNLDTAIFIAPRQNGKSQILVLITMVELLLNKKKILFTSHEVASCEDFFRKITFEFESNPIFNNEVSKIIRQRGAQEIVLTNGACIQFRARTKSAGIGGSNEVLIFDEFQFVTDAMMSAMLPTISAMGNPKVIYAGTCPRLIDDDVFLKEWLTSLKASQIYLNGVLAIVIH
ncbi:terminase large subunit domain-containing protein [Mycoplasma sp. P36-A1]|uniref:terminase large subunit domain-containing protein n=1 Tax=Mycoplasma sp. P36-A1 TaxID=3252900 RepID=UPI003C2C2453